MSSVWNFNAQIADVSLRGLNQRHPMWSGCICTLWYFMLVSLIHKRIQREKVREHFQKFESVSIVGIGMESNSDCGESEVFYCPRFGLQILIRIFLMRPVWVSSDARNLNLSRHHTDQKRYNFASIIYDSLLGAVEFNWSVKSLTSVRRLNQHYFMFDCWMKFDNLTEFNDDWLVMLIQTSNKNNPRQVEGK